MRSLLCLLFVAACTPTPMKPDDTSPSAPTRQRAEVQPDGTVIISWKTPTDGDLARVLLARFLPGGTATRPEGTPAVGDAIGVSGTVMALTLDESFIDRAPPVTCGALAYRLWSQDSRGRWSIDQALVELAPGATTPAPAQTITNLVGSVRDNSLFLSWTNPPSSTGYFQTAVVRKLGSAPTSPSDGAAVSTGPVVAYREPLASFRTGDQLFYAVFSCNTCGGCRADPAVFSYTVPEPASDAGLVDAGFTDAGVLDAGSVDAGVLDGGSTDAGLDAGASPDAGILTPAAFTASLSVDGQRVQLSWVNGSSPALARVRLTRVLTESGTPQAPVTVFEGAASSTTERVDRLLPSTATTTRTYTYQVVGCSTSACESSGPTAPLTLTLTQALRGGGYTLFWRHASASVCGDQTTLCPSSLPPGQTCAQALATTTAANWWRTCLADPPTCSTTARQLTPALAANETTAVRTWFQTKGVSVGRVLTSEYCRCFTTAQDFMFGPTLEYSQDLTYWVYEESLRCPKTMALLHQTPAPGTNTAMVSHAGFFCPTLDSLAWGEAAIYKPQAPTTRTCTTVGSCGSDEACVQGACVRPLLIARVPALGTGSWSTLP